MSSYVEYGCLTDFLEFLLKEELKRKKEESEQKIWELWLHKVFDKSYNDFRASIKECQVVHQKPKEMDNADIDNAVSIAMQTIEILNRGGEGHESV